MTGLLPFSLAVGLFAPAASVAQRPSEPDAGAFVERSARCPAAARHCFGIFVHIALHDGRPVEAPAWLRAQVETANRLFAPIAVGFEVARAEIRDDIEPHIVSRRQRDRLGRSDFSKSVVHLYLVGKLDNVDAVGEISGVHWRDRGNVKRRWIILSTRANRYVLAHELGHFFGLPHSRYHTSIMNKRPRNIGWDEFEFVERERRKMAARRDEMLADGTLVPRGGS